MFLLWVDLSQERKQAEAERSSCRVERKRGSLWLKMEVSSFVAEESRS